RLLCLRVLHLCSLFFPFTAPSTPHTYTLSLHDALPISHARRNNQAGFLDFRYRPHRRVSLNFGGRAEANANFGTRVVPRAGTARSEEHTSELQSLAYLVCRLLLEKKKKKL